MSASMGYLAIDVGSSRVKLGLFPSAGECSVGKPASSLPIAAPRLPQPSETLTVPHDDHAMLWTKLGAWLETVCPPGAPGYIASVHPESLTLIQEMFAHRLQVLTTADLPITVRVDQPDRVGIDRLLNAVAVNRLRKADCPALVVDLGTACTVDLIAPDGAFAGGAILPGLALSAGALHTGTASLPQLTAEDFQAVPPAIGKSTQAAISAGIYWGMIGAARELLIRMAEDCSIEPQLFVTGGGAPLLALHLATDYPSLRHLPGLVLSGIALVAEGRS